MEQQEIADCKAMGDEPESGTETRALAASLERAAWEALRDECRSAAPDKIPSPDNGALCLVRPVPAVGGELRFYRGLSQPFRPHSHDFLVIGLVAEGERLLVCNGENRLIVPGDLIVFGPGDVHGCRQQGEALFSYISITVSPRFLPAVRLRGPVVRDVGAAREFAALVRRLLQGSCDGKGFANNGGILAGEGPSGPEPASWTCVAAGNSADAFGAEDDASVVAAEAGAVAMPVTLAPLLERLRATESLKRLEPPTETSAAHDAAACRTEALLRERLSESVELRTVAAQEGISEYSLIRAYRRRYSITPIQHLISLRTERACGLLAAGEPPAEAARDAGFADQAHLTRAFKQRIGTTPAAYRKMACEKEELR